MANKTYLFTDPYDYVFDVLKIEFLLPYALLKSLPLSNLYLYNKFDETSGLIASDSSGNARHGAFTGGMTAASWQPGKINNGIEGDNIEASHINYGNICQFERTQPFTIHYWFNINTVLPQIYLSNRISSGIGFDVLHDGVTTPPGGLDFTMRDSSGKIIRVDSSGGYDTSTWHLLIITYDGSSSSNGVQIDVDNMDDTNIFTPNTLTGSTLPTNPFRVSGWGQNIFSIHTDNFIDELRIFNRVLTTEEKTFLWNFGAGTQALGVYNLTNPTIRPGDPIITSAITGFDASFIAEQSDQISFVLYKDAVPFWFNGSSWVGSSGYSESNTLEEIQLNIGTFLTEETYFNWGAYLHSEIGASTPKINLVNVDYEGAPSVKVGRSDNNVLGGYLLRK